ncbi:MarR family transcriptional regulator [Brachybacterium paraconglomeratum]|uniref:MarR family winged helix-turn-helix transcriptional regulator n=1 Tax=Brachybacterium paraconglomeratum TaxID=173362 RepID=UPI0031F029FE
MTSPSLDKGPSPEPTPPTSLFSLEGSDPHQELIDRTGLTSADISQIDALMAALSRLRVAERELSEASLRYMQLGETDMRALHFLIVCENTGVVVTPGAISQELQISSASTTKLLDRLERAGHIRRTPHPSDRRALVIGIDPATRATAIRTVGSMQARRVHAARRLTSAEREIVSGFLDDMAREISLGNADWSDTETDDDQH